MSDYINVGPTQMSLIGKRGSPLRFADITELNKDKAAKYKFTGIYKN